MKKKKQIKNLEGFLEQKLQENARLEKENEKLKRPVRYLMGEKYLLENKIRSIEKEYENLKLGIRENKVELGIKQIDDLKKENLRLEEQNQDYRTGYNEDRIAESKFIKEINDLKQKNRELENTILDNL